jgi:hypothetical protein
MLETSSNSYTLGCSIGCKALTLTILGFPFVMVGFLYTLSSMYMLVNYLGDVDTLSKIDLGAILTILGIFALGLLFLLYLGLTPLYMAYRLIKHRKGKS